METEIRRLRLDFGRWYDIVRDGKFILARCISTRENIRTQGAEVMRKQLEEHHRVLRTRAPNWC